MANQVVRIGKYECGPGQRLVLIAGPCVIEGFDLADQIAGHLVDVCNDLNIGYVFKASFDKANRTSGSSFRGVGIDQGLDVLKAIGEKYGIPTTTDIHEPDQAAKVAEVCDILQIPAFLARQTDLLVAAAQTGKIVNVKKGQFMSPADMKNVVKKLEDSGTDQILLCERGTFFGYGNLVNDMRAIPQMQSHGVPVIFDATHSVQQPGGLGNATGGNREMVEPLARAAVAIGTDGVFLETHPEPEKSPSDGPNMVPLAQIKAVLEKLVSLRDVVLQWNR